MHELPACEIPLLWCSRPPVWTATSAMHPVQTHLDHSPPEARTSSSSNSGLRPPSRVRAGLHAGPALFQTSRRCPGGLSLPLSASTAPVCCSIQPPEDSDRASRALSRWPLVSVRRPAMGSLFDRAQTLPAQLRDLPRSPAVSGERGGHGMAARRGRDSAGRPLSHSSPRRGQSPRDARYRSSAWLGAAALPFPLAAQAASPSPRRAVRPPWGTGAPRDLPAHQQRALPSGGTALTPLLRTPASLVSRRLRNSPDSNGGARILTRATLLSGLPHPSRARPAADHQCRRIHGPHSSRNAPQQPGGLEPGIPTSLGNRPYSDEVNCDL